MRKKIIGLIFNLSIIAAIAAYLFFSYAITGNIVYAQTGGGLSEGGRIVTVIFSPPPPVGPIAPCSSGVYYVSITPYGGANQPILCIPLTMLTVGPPVTPSSVGGQILGLFSVLAPIAAPIGLVGTSF